MQRMPTRSMPPHGSELPMESASPMLLLARRIREEQGVEQVRAFLAAMTPFSAPNEIRHIGEGFGIPFESIELERERTVKSRQPVQENRQNPQNGMLDQLRMIMQLSSLMKGGDAMNLINMLGGK